MKPFSKYTTAQWGYSALGSISRLNDLMLKVSPELKIDSMFEATKNNLINDWKYLIGELKFPGTLRNHIHAVRCIEDAKEIFKW